MAEASFSIRSFNVLKVRLDPTDVQGRDVGGLPVLSFPLKLQLLPAGPEQTGLQYVLLRLAGSVSGHPIGEFASFDAGPLAEASHPSAFERHCEVSVPLDRVRVKRFEDARAGSNAGLTLSFSGLVWLSAPQSTFERIHASSQLQIDVPKSHWAERVLHPWGLDSVKLVELTFPKSEAGENFRAAYSHVETAEKHFANGEYKQVLVELHSAFEGLARELGFSNPDQQFFAHMLAEFHPEKKEKTKLALDYLCGFLHLGRHQPKTSPETFQISRSDARFGLVMAHSVFEYITPKG